MKPDEDRFDYHEQCEARREREQARNPLLRWCACGRKFAVDPWDLTPVMCLKCEARKEMKA